MNDSTQPPSSTDDYVTNPVAAICFISACATVGLIVWIAAAHGWTDRGWIALGAIGAVAQAVIVGVAAAIALLQLRASESLRRDQTRPFVIMRLEPEEFGHSIYLVVENIGATPAKNIRFAVNPPLESSFTWWHPPRFAIEGLTFLAPGQRYSTLFEGMVERNDALKRGLELPSAFEVKATYESFDGELITDPPVLLDVDAANGSFFPGRKTIHNVVEEIKALNKTLGSATSPDGIKVVHRSLDDVREEARAQPEEWKMDMRRTYDRRKAAESAPEAGEEDKPEPDPA